MSDPSDPTAAEARRIARNKLLGRIAIIALGILVLIQVVPMFLSKS